MKYYIHFDRWFFGKESGYTGIIKDALSFESKDDAIEFLRRENMIDFINDFDILTEDELLVLIIIE